MTTTKHSYGFRISAQAEQHLNHIVNATGVTKTSAVEMAIVKLSQSLKEQKMENGDNRSFWFNRLDALNLGDYSSAYGLSEIELMELVRDLESAREKGKLDLETEDGISTLERIWNSYCA